MKTTATSITIVEKVKGGRGETLVKSRSKSRDILSNITNKRASDVTGNTSKKSGRKSLISAKKRPSALLENDLIVLKSKAKTNKKNKKRKSDPMAVDGEETRESSANSLSVIPYEDIDQKDYGDPQSVAEYVADIYTYLMEKEKDAVDPHYLNNQVEVNEKMRAVLIDWLIEVHCMFKLIPETLFFCVSLIDRYLFMILVSRDTL